jgi:hypothetical protein
LVKTDRYFYDVDAIRSKPRQAKVINGSVVSATGVSGVRYRRQIELSTAVRSGKVIDFVGIELQTLDTTGTVWPERQRFLQNHGITVRDVDVSSGKGFGMNWKMTAKTILMQLHHKIHTFEHLSKHLVLVAQDCLIEYMQREFSFEHIQSRSDRPNIDRHPLR